MKLTDLQPLEAWAALEAAIHEKSGLRARVYDIDGVGITDKSAHANELCPAIRSTSKGLTFICAVAHQNLAAMAQNSREPVVEECDAGLIKIVVPIFVGDEFVGAAGGCGLLAADGEVDDFMINKTTELPEAQITELAARIGTITAGELEELTAFIAAEVQRLVARPHAG
ncbi:MAG: PocR ligand-binding domain-containing protein [Desulfobacterales bacterium]|nr:PocR ligand-binding domain-containing protein [Desulfobacterales bacterium]MDJ0886384.1 PocR ligand-binding domain-containing protein [Desulfobacterales bacterium]MDJ0989268.1 PocR ligand-binding domain-containing protein [Desulfobacterales bacterium]